MMINRILSKTLMLIGTSLLLLTVYGRLIYAPPLSQYANQDFPRQKQLAKLNKADRSEPLAYAMAVTDYFHYAVKHGWKPESQHNNLTQFSYNWSYAFLRFLSLTKAAGNLKVSQQALMPLEYYDYRDTVARGIGYCSQNALAISDYLQRQGYLAKTVGINGHVISTAHIDPTSEYILDGDYNVVLPFSLAFASNHPDTVRRHYLDKGASPRATKIVVKMYTKSNYRDTDRIHHLFDTCLVVNWLAPISLILLSLLLGRMKFMKITRRERNKLI